MPMLGRIVKPGLVSVERGNSGLYITPSMGPENISRIFVSCFLPMWASLIAQLVENLPAMRETWVRSLGWEDPLEKGKAAAAAAAASKSLQLCPTLCDP